MTNRMESSLKIAALASTPEIAYTPNGKYEKNGTRLWHGVTANSVDGRSWDYWLSYDFGSYRGSYEV